MKGIVIVQTKEGGRLEWLDIPKPEPAPGELLMRVKAVGVNRADLLQPKGLYDPTQKMADGMVAGLEAAGEVAGIGKHVSGFKEGDRIMALCRGGYAEFTTLDHRLAMPVPGRLSWEEAASVPAAYMTEHDALITNGRLQVGETVLVTAASSGVGVAAIQIAKFWGAKIVIATASTPAKLAALKTLGMDTGINYRTENFADAVFAATNGTGADLIIDHVGALHLKENLRCLALKGRLVNIGHLGGTMTGELNFELMGRKRLQLIGASFRSRTVDERIDIARRIVADLLPPLADGRLKPVVNRVFPLHQAAEAWAYMESGVQVGKIVLKV
jgi:NADPH:quinone reductase